MDYVLSFLQTDTLVDTEWSLCLGLIEQLKAKKEKMLQLGTWWFVLSRVYSRDVFMQPGKLCFRHCCYLLTEIGQLDYLDGFVKLLLTWW